MHIQEYWVREKAKRAVSGIKYSGIECARVNPRAIQALKRIRADNYRACQPNYKHRSNFSNEITQKEPVI